MRDKEFEDIFFENKMSYMELFDEGKTDEGIKLLKETWELFNEPKVSNGLFYLLVKDVINLCINLKKYDVANKYIGLLFIAGPNRADGGEKEFLSGKLAYEQGDLEIAKELFYVANFKCKGRLFRGKENKKYKDILEMDRNEIEDKVNINKADNCKKEAKDNEEVVNSKEQSSSELSDESYGIIVANCKYGDEEVENGNYNEAIQHYIKALELVPEPKTKWQASTWIYTALGDTYFVLCKYEEAKNYLFDALNCPDGITNPFILLRLGECLYKLGDINKSKEYLLKAYMLEGDSIFEDEDEEYYKIIEDMI